MSVDTSSSLLLRRYPSDSQEERLEVELIIKFPNVAGTRKDVGKISKIS